MADPALEHLEAELRKFPAALQAAYEAALPIIPNVGAVERVRWGQEGVRIARQSGRAWEPAVEYFRASPRVMSALSYPQFQRWVDSGIELSNDSPTMAAAYFRASPDVIGRLSARNLTSWGALGKGLSRGTWKSASLAARFFDASPELVAHLTFRELERFVGLVDALSYRSYDLAADCLHLGQRVLPSIEEREELISLASAVVDGSWREVRGCFEVASRASTLVERRLRGRFFKLTERVARSGVTNISLFMSEVTQSLSRLPESQHESVMAKAEELVEDSVEAVGAFLRSAPNVLSRISDSQYQLWFEQGYELLKENPDAGVAFFRIESSRAEAALEQLSAAVELERVKELLTRYSNALAGSAVTLDAASELAHRNIGWVEVEQATTDGLHIYLPSSVERYAQKVENFAWLKVVATHQVGHIEFGSFELEFERPSTMFDDLRMRLERTAGEHAATSMARFFDLFPNRTLASDIFGVTEDARTDTSVVARYRGLAPDYGRVQTDALSTRPTIQQLPLQQAMVEMLIRLSLHQKERLPVPKQYTEEARSLAGLLRTVQVLGATVEDSAEAAIRMYTIISNLHNQTVDPEDWQEEDFENAQYQEPDGDSLSSAFQDAPGGKLGEGEEGEDYESPEDIDYRGGFKPEMVQLLTMMRAQAEDSADGMDLDSLSQEALEELLRDSIEIDVEQDSDLSTMATNLMKEITANTQPKDEGAGHTDIPHQDEDGGALEPAEPTSYVYDEWDFRANDYRPRWCVVQEKQVSSGDSRFYQETLQTHAGLMEQIRRQFESIRPEMYRRVKHLPEGEDVDFDSALQAMIEIRSRRTPDERIYWRRNKAERDVGVVFLLDMSASTAEAVEETKKGEADADIPSDPVAYTLWMRTRRGEGVKRQYKRIIDVEKESMVLLMTALETIGDRYGVYGFSGFGRENVEFYVIKDLEAPLTETVKRRLDKVSPLHATRMGPAIRHATKKLDELDAKVKFLFVVSDGRPQDRGYSREGVEKEYAVQDTRMALLEARQKDITPFCLTVDRQGHDYMRTMAGDMGYEVVPDITDLPRRLPALYRRLTV